MNINILKTEVSGDVIHATIAVVKDGKETFSTVINVRSKEELDARLERLKSVLNEQARISVGAWTAPAKTLPTAEELKEQELAELKRKAEQAYSDYEKKIITQEEYDAVVATYRSKLTTK
jgi:O-glycosyl hydrolase